MKVLYQWAFKNPTDWQEVDAKDWHTLPKRPIPEKGELGGLDNESGWLRNVSVQGITAEGYDHVAIEPITIGNDEGVEYTLWNDDPDDPDNYSEIGSVKGAIVWTILPLASDPKVGMAINTRQSCVWYAQGPKYDRLVNHPPQNTTIRPLSEFIPPADNVTRHGVWLTKVKLGEHIEAVNQKKNNWAHWNDHLPNSECEVVDGVRVLKEQRKQGRYHRAAKTITYYQRSADRAYAGGVATNEDALETTTTTSSTETVTLDSSRVVGWAFSTDGTTPANTNWNGVYHVQLNATTVSAGVTYGIESTTEKFPGWNRYVTGISPSSNWIPANGNGDENDFSGTGLKLVTSDSVTITANTTDVFAFLVAATGDSHGDVITLTLNTTDSYADGPWTAGATITADKWHPTSNIPVSELIGVVSYFTNALSRLRQILV